MYSSKWPGASVALLTEDSCDWMDATHSGKTDFFYNDIEKETVFNVDQKDQKNYLVHWWFIPAPSYDWML